MAKRPRVHQARGDSQIQTPEQNGLVPDERSAGNTAMTPSVDVNRLTALGLQTRTPLEEGLIRTYAWFCHSCWAREA